MSMLMVILETDKQTDTQGSFKNKSKGRVWQKHYSIHDHTDENLVQEHKN